MYQMDIPSDTNTWQEVNFHWKSIYMDMPMQVTSYTLHKLSCVLKFTFMMNGNSSSHMINLKKRQNYSRKNV
jgi:hypothetical protein